MKLINDLTQGSEKWLEFRKAYFCASEAPAMMNESKYITRNQLLDHKKGWTTEVDKFTQRLFDEGHATEQKALPIVEQIVGEELYPVVGVMDKYLASFDGLTMMEDVIFEHKIWNKTLVENIQNNLIEPNYYWQLEHQLLVSGAGKVIFVCSDGTDENLVYMEYYSLPERREALIKGWEQFEKDLEKHELKAKKEKVTPIKQGELPVIRYEMNGLSLTSNLDEFKAQADKLVEVSQKSLESDQDFADAEARQKVFTKAEKDIKDLADRVLSEVADIDKFTKDLRYIGEQIRQARLAESKQIKTRKEELKNEILGNSCNEIKAFKDAIQSEIKAVLPQSINSISEAMKGKKTVESLQNAADSAVAEIKIELNDYAAIARANINTLKELASDYKFLFSDWKDIAFKANDDFEALVKTRISEHKEREQERLEQERERIRQEEQAKAEKEAEKPTKTTSKPIEKNEEVEPISTEPANKVAPDLSLTEYQQGYLDGLEAYAWWKNGVEYVGTGGQTYEAAAKLFLSRGKAA